MRLLCKRILGHVTTHAPPAPPIFPVSTARLTLRHHRNEDLEDLLAYYSDPDVCRYLLNEPWDVAEAEKQMAIRLGRLGIGTVDSGLSVVVELDSALIGDIALRPADETLSVGSIGWVFNPSHAGHGYATEAVRAVIAIAFNHYGMHRLKAQLDVRNTSSARLCERLGMTKEAHLREEWWNKGEWTDNAIYGLLRSDVNVPHPSPAR